MDYYWIKELDIQSYIKQDLIKRVVGITVITNKQAGRKVVSSLLISLIMTVTLLFYKGDTFHITTFIYTNWIFNIFTFLIGVPLSLLADIIIYKISNKLIYMSVGLLLHFIFAVFIFRIFFRDELAVSDWFSFGFFAGQLDCG